MPLTQDSIAKKRQTGRDSLYLNAELFVDGVPGPVTVRVRNLSQGGMMVDGDPALPLGSRIKTDLRGIGEIGGDVVWSSPERAGIAFDREVDPKRARYPVAPKAERIVYGRTFVYSSRPGLKPRP